MPHSTLNTNSAVVTINSVSLTPIEVDSQRVVTLAMVDQVHERATGTARKRFNDNKARMKEGTHFAKMSASVFRTRFPGVISDRVTEDVTLLTERGYLMLVKSFTDDLAWEVQDMLVESYFNKPVTIVGTPKVHPGAGREARLTLKQNLLIAKLAGFTGNQALLAANKATLAMTGIDTLALMGGSHLPAPSNDALLTPTEIGRRADAGGPRAVNQMLCGMGLQHAFRDANNHIYYELTDEGRAAGGQMLDTGKKHSTGVPIRQLKWPSSILGLIQENVA